MIENEIIFLIAVGLIWIIGAILQDLRRREVDNIWNFSLIGIALAYRLAYSVLSGEWLFFGNGLLGLFIFVILGNVFYYSRIFAGGDAKLLIALGSILPLSFDWIINATIFGSFIVLFLFGGSLYVFIYALFLVAFARRAFMREFAKQAHYYRYFFIGSFIFFFICLLFSFYFQPLILFGSIFLLFPFLFVFAKAVEESCLVKSVSPSALTEGEWLYEDIFVGGKKIRANWDGVSKRELALLREKYRRNILIKQGIPFTPGFLIGFVGLIIIGVRFGWL